MNWSLVFGLGSLVVGQLSLVTGHWSPVTYSMENGPWTMDNGQFPCSLWLVACGLVGLLYSSLIIFFTIGWYRKRESAVGGRRSAVSSSQFAVRSLQSAVGGRRSAVSIVVAVRNEEKNIADLLDDLLFQDYPKDLIQVIIIDDHSSDHTFGIVEDFIGRNKSSTIILLKTEDYNISGKKAALKLGIEKAAGDIILTTDADCRVGPGWISSLVNYFDDEKIKMVFGPVKYFERKEFWNGFQSMEFAGLVASGAGAALAGHPFLCNGANLAYLKDAFLKVKGFEGNEKYISGDDVFLLHKMKKKFGRRSVVFCKNENATVKTYPAEGLKNFVNQRIRWASKSKGYKDALSIITAIIIFSYSLTVLSTFIAGIFDSRFFLISFGLLFWKMIIDLPLMIGVTGFFHQKNLLKWYPVFQVIYPVYIVAAGFLSFFKRNSW